MENFKIISRNFPYSNLWEKFVENHPIINDKEKTISEWVGSINYLLNESPKHSELMLFGASSVMGSCLCELFAAEWRVVRNIHNEKSYGLFEENLGYFSYPDKVLSSYFSLKLDEGYFEKVVLFEIYSIYQKNTSPYTGGAHPVLDWIFFDLNQGLTEESITMLDRWLDLRGSGFWLIDQIGIDGVEVEHCNKRIPLLLKKYLE